MTGFWPLDKVSLPGYNKKASVTLGYAQVAFGTFAFLAGWFTLITDAEQYDLGYGQWGGLIVFITGCLGIAAGQEKRRDLVMAYLVSSVVGVIISAVMGILAAVMLNYDLQYSCRLYDDIHDTTYCGTEGTAGAIASESVILGMAVAGFISLICSAKVASYGYHSRNIKSDVSGDCGSSETGATQTDRYPSAAHPSFPQTTHMAYASPNTIPTMNIVQPVVVQTTTGPLILRPVVVPLGYLPGATSSNWTSPTLLTPGTTDASDTPTPIDPNDLPPSYDVTMDDSGPMDK